MKVFKRLGILCLVGAFLLVIYRWHASGHGQKHEVGEKWERVRIVPAGLLVVPTRGTSTPGPTTRQQKASTGANTVVSTTEWINPGCRERMLNKYRPVYAGKVYSYPSIVHYAKLTWSNQQVSLNFREYTSVLSVYKFIQPERIIFHTNTDMVGEYWNKISSWENVQIELNKIPRVHTVGGRHISYIQHEADYVKLRALYNYGGVTLDFDVIIVNGTKLRQEQMISECILSEEGDYINGGFHSCIKHSPFIAKWLEGYDKDYRPQLWLHNVSYKPTFLLTGANTTVCYNVYLDDTISIKPHWGIQREWLGNKVRWRTKTAAHYFVKTGITSDSERLLNEKHSLAQLLRYVHEA